MSRNIPARPPGAVNYSPPRTRQDARSHRLFKRAMRRFGNPRHGMGLSKGNTALLPHDERGWKLRAGSPALKEGSGDDARE